MPKINGRPKDAPREYDYLSHISRNRGYEIRKRVRSITELLDELPTGRDRAEALNLVLDNYEPKTFRKTKRPLPQP